MVSNLNSASDEQQPVLADSPISLGLSDRTAFRLSLVLLTIGLVWRTARYLLRFPVWGDEALLAINFAWFDYGELTRRLENCQIAPLVFLWGERAAFTWLGASELSLRLIPYLASVVALGLFWRLTGLMLSPPTRLLAVGFLAIANFPIVMSNSLKPYSLDLMTSLALSVPAVRWLQTPTQKRWLIALTLIAPLALLSSYPAAFVAGGVSVALLRNIWRQSWSARCWFAAYNVTLLAGFAAAYVIGANQLRTTTGGTSTQVGMALYWAHGFPPSSPWAWPLWFVRMSTGQMMAYPVGDANGGSILTVVCVAAGAIALWRQRGRAYLALFGTPLVLNVIAAAMHRYPYGAAARLSQHLAPAICILAGLGLATLIARTRPRAQLRWSIAVVAIFTCIGLGGLARDLIHPYYSRGAAWMRTAMREMRLEVPDAAPVVVCGDSNSIEAVLTWYWLNQGQHVWWNYAVPDSPASGQIWGFHQGAGADLACQRLEQQLTGDGASWRLARRIPYVYKPHSRKEAPQQCELFCFERVDEREIQLTSHEVAADPTGDDQMSAKRVSASPNRGSATPIRSISDR